MLESSQERRLAGADDLLVRAALSNIDNESADMTICSLLTLLRPATRVSILLAPTAEAALKHWDAIEQPLFDKAKAAVIGVVTAAGEKIVVQPPLPVSGWEAGGALWLSELCARLSSAMRTELTEILTGNNIVILASAISESSALLIGCLHVRRLAARIRFTRLVDGAVGGGDGAPNPEEAARWIAAERAELKRLVAGPLDKRQRKAAVFFSTLTAELEETLQAVRAHLLTAPPTSKHPPLVALRELRASHDALSGRAFLSVATGEGYEESPVEFGFHLAESHASQMLVVTEGAKTSRRAFFHEFLGSQPGVTCHMGPAGTGKTETFRDHAAEIGRPFCFLGEVPTDRPSLERMRKRCRQTQRILPGVIMCVAGESLGADVLPSHVFTGFTDDLARPRVKATHSKFPPDSKSPMQRCGMFCISLGLAKESVDGQKTNLSTTADAILEDLSKTFGPFQPADVGRLGRLGRHAWGTSKSGSFVEFAPPDLGIIIEDMGNAEGMECSDGAGRRMYDLIEGLKAGTMAVSKKHVEELGHAGDDSGTDAVRRVLSERPMHNGMTDFGLRQIKTYLLHAGQALRASYTASPATEALSYAIASTPAAFSNKAFPDRHRAPEEETLLSLAIRTGDHALIRCAVDARDRACRWHLMNGMNLIDSWHDASPGRAFKQFVRPFTAMDVALLLVYSPDLALEVLGHRTMIEEPGDGHRYVDLLEAASLDALLPAALRSAAVEKVFATPVFGAILQSRMRVLWPLFALEYTLLSTLCATYIAWAFGVRACAIPSILLAAFFAIVELVQFASSLRPLFGDPSLRRWMSHIFDPYNILDVSMAAAVIATISVTASPSESAGAVQPSPAPRTAEAVTVLLMLLKMISHLRAFEAFGFLVSMLLSTARAMLSFGVLLLMMICGFSVIFTLLGTRAATTDATDAVLQLDGIAPDATTVLASVDQLSLRLWDMYRLGTMGDFDADDFNGPAIALFIVITLAINVVMLNVLITIVGESYTQAQANRADLSRQTRAGIISDLETAYLAPWCSRRVVRRGRPCGVLTHPRWLAALAGMRVHTVHSRHERHNDPARSSSRTLALPLQSYSLLSLEWNVNNEMTERGLLRQRTEEIAAQQAETLSSLTALTAMVGELGKKLASKDQEGDSERKYEYRPLLPT